VPDAILRKQGKLTEEEWTIMRTHPVVGAEVVGLIPALRPIAPIVRAHHERMDGQGYPDGIKGEDIPLGARVIAVADAYSAMTSDRPYRMALPADAALKELRTNSGTQFDPAILDAFESILSQQTTGARSAA
jgi:HD-GYP domain-containing protein (c-di-GMP phosphodiesterase class II)